MATTNNTQLADFVDWYNPLALNTTTTSAGSAGTGLWSKSVTISPGTTASATATSIIIGESIFQEYAEPLDPMELAIKKAAELMRG